MNAPTPLLDFFRRGEATKDVRLEAARGALAPRALEQAEILLLLLDDPDEEVSAAAGETLRRIPAPVLAGFVGMSDVPQHVRDAFAKLGVVSAGASAEAADGPLVDTDPVPDDDAPDDEGDEATRRVSVTQQIMNMGFSDRLKAAVKGTREMRAVLIRDPNKMISAAVLSSPKLTDAEIEGFARMASLPEETLRIIASNRSWTKNYRIVVGLTRNPKTPLTMSLNFMSRLNDRDLQVLSMDRNVPDPLRVAARKRIVAATSRK